MATLDQTKRQRAQSAAAVRLMPGVGEAAKQSITTSRAFACAEGEYWCLSSTKDFYVATHATAAVASAASTPLPAGVHDFVVPDGVGSVAIFSATSGAEGAAWRS